MLFLLIFLNLLGFQNISSILKVLPDHLKNKEGYLIFSISLEDCISCINELKIWSEYYKNNRETHGVFLLLVTEKQKSVVEKFKELYQIPCDIIIDTSGNLSKSIGLSETPSLGLFTQKGALIYKQILGQANVSSITEYYKKVDSLINNTFVELIEIYRKIYNNKINPIGRLTYKSPIQYNVSNKSFLIVDNLFQQIVVTDLELVPNYVISKKNFDENGIKGNIIGACLDGKFIAILFEILGKKNDIIYAVFLFDYESQKLSKFFYLDYKDLIPGPPLMLKKRDLFISLNYDKVSGIKDMINDGTIGIIDIDDGKLKKKFAPLDTLYLTGFFPHDSYSVRYDIDSKGNFYVIHPLSYKINKYDYSGKRVATFGEPSLNYKIEPPFKREPNLEEEGLFLEKSTFYLSVICGEDGNVYVAHREGGNVYYSVYSEDSSFIYQFISPGGFLVRVDKEGILYFFEYKEELVLKKFIAKTF